mmetsp:Transcript_5566/g.17572  ORF Transcript_5566/g.17572 Transcript_5566/m.17572 type:complete len:774 (+) Transcript_5566:1115-3436(+)
MLGAIERYVKQAIVDKNSMVSSSALVAGAHLIGGSPDVVRRWVNEVQEALHSPSEMVQFHALSLLYEIRQHDRLAISKMVAQLTRGTVSSPMATCLLIRYITTILRGYGPDMLASANGRAAYQFLELSLRHRSESVIYEAAKALISLPSAEERDLAPAVAVLQLFLSSPKSTLRLAAMRALSDVAIAKPAAIIKCNDDMESLIADSNRSIATFAITTLLKTGSEASIDRLMKQISSFMNEIADEFKIVVVTAIRELCLKYPLKHRVLVGFLANFLREEGGFEFKKAIVDAIVALICAIPETKESSLFHLCEFIEDCEFTALSTQILHLVGSLGPTTAAPARYIRFVYNRIILENAVVRAAAVAALTKFAAKLPALRASVSVLLRRSLRDEDDEVRDRATLALRLLGEDLKSILASPDEQREISQGAVSISPPRPANQLLLEPLPMPFFKLAQALEKFEMIGGHDESSQALTMSTLPIVEDARPAALVHVSSRPNSISVDGIVSELHKVPELTALGPVFRSTPPIDLTESETEYVVSYIKHVMLNHVVLEFMITNTIDEQVLLDACINLEATDDSGHYTVESSIRAPELRCGETSRSWLVLQHDASTEFTFAAQFVAELRFRAVDIDPGTGEIQGDQGGFPEEYPLEDVELCTPDFMSEVKIVDIDFRAMWEAMDASGEVLEKCVLQTRELESAVTNITACLGMRSKDREHAVDMVTKNVSSHSFHIVGTLVGSIKFLIRAQIQQSDEKAACLLKMAVRSPDAVVSRAVASCIK